MFAKLALIGYTRFIELSAKAKLRPSGAETQSKVGPENYGFYEKHNPGTMQNFQLFVRQNTYETNILTSDTNQHKDYTYMLCVMSIQYNTNLWNFKMEERKFQTLIS